MDTTIRYATIQDLEQLINLWDVCFEDPISWRNWYFENRFSPEHTLVLEVDCRIVSAMQIRYYPYKIAKSTVVAPNLLGVCTHPEFRGRGFMGQLLDKLTLDLYDEGVPFLLNTPTDALIYSKHSHAQVFKKKICTTIGGNSAVPNTGDTFNIYSIFSDVYSFMVQRDSLLMNERISDVTSDGGHICSNEGAYALYHIEDHKCTIDELCFIDIHSLQKLFSRIDSKCITFELPFDVECPENALFKEFAPILARIVHLENLMKILPYSLPTDVKVCDKLIVQNNTTLKREKSSTNCEIELDIGELTMLIFSKLLSFNTNPH